MLVLISHAQAMMMQLDLRIEAANLNRFRSNFASERSLRERVCFPEPIQPFVAEAVLVETYVHGRPVKEYADADIDTRTELSRVGVQAGVATRVWDIFQNDNGGTTCQNIHTASQSNATLKSYD